MARKPRKPSISWKLANSLTSLKVYLKKNNRVPVVGIPFNPTIEGISERQLEFRWYRLLYEKLINCCIHKLKPAPIHCLMCSELRKSPIQESYHCSSECYYQYHNSDHWKKVEKPEVFTYDLLDDYLIYKNLLVESDHGSWLPIGNEKVYVPTRDDFGCILKLEVSILDRCKENSLTSVVLTDHVIEAPHIPRLRSLIPIRPSFKFKVLSYNLLADFYIGKNYTHCPQWCQTWEYRRQNLLTEICSYNADVLCLQEVQDNHFEHFFKPELERLGYCARYKGKIDKIYTCDGYVREGCATFVRRDMFKIDNEYELIYRKVAQPILDSLPLGPTKKALASKRLSKDNVALVVILKFHDTTRDYSDPAKDFSSMSLCVANVHIHSGQSFQDTKLWQVATLLNGLERINNPSLPILICCDLNSQPGSAPFDLVVKGDLCNHADIPHDPFCVLPRTRLEHNLKLVSAYRFWQATGEQPITHFTQKFSGTLDYIFYSEDKLMLQGLLELLGREDILKQEGLPSPDLSSDHVALMAEFCFWPKSQEHYNLPNRLW